MAGSTPHEGEDVPEASPTSGGRRRSGLERLRATREGASGGVSSESAAGADAAEPGVAGEARSTAAGRGTALLDTPTRERSRSRTTDARAADDPTSDTQTLVDDEDSAATGTGPAARRSRQRKRRAAGGKAAGGKATGGTSAPTAGTSAPRRRVIAAVLLGVLVVGLLVPAVLLRDRLTGGTSEQRAVTNLVDKRDEALGVARRFTITFFSPDYKTIDDYNRTVAAQTVGDFNKDFVGKQGELKTLLTRVQSQATGRVLSAGVSKVSGNDVEVLVVADQDVRNTVSKGQTVTNRYRVRVSLRQTDQGWVVTNFEPVQ